jgi:hypothetical protein
LRDLRSMIDDETRFWIAQEVADMKDTHDASHLFQVARKRAGKRPGVLITDGLRSYHDAWLKEFRTNKQVDSTVHIRQITLTVSTTITRWSELTAKCVTARKSCAR